MKTTVAAAAVAVGLAACGGSGRAPGITTAPGGGATVAPATTTPASTTTSPTSTTASTPKAGPLSREPKITIPKGPAPTALKKTDLIVGHGATAASGDHVQVNYVGALYSNGHIFDSSWKDTPGKAFAFQLGVNQVIKGWDEGVAGMKVGGRRELIIPPSLAYGKSGSGSTIPPNATLVFIVDLLAVSK
ncbi:MAG: FKBP-type peptidyl-prolyl cis-trans isomerase [Conexibacteraceae bacterium]|nr:FKBP-type peptidyl-prolyl cis-trans isomerase [Conexibacteraceae bacterium]